MKPCPFCAEEIQEAAIVCKHCGRDLKGGAQQVQIVAPKKKTGCVAGGCAVVLVLFVIMFISSWSSLDTARQQAARRPVAQPKGSARPSGGPPAAPVPASKPSENNNRRLFRENSKWDDGAREYIFKTALRKSGERCDSIERSIMTTPGTWVVSCAPGYRYSFSFDKEGDLKAAMRLP